MDISLFPLLINRLLGFLVSQLIDCCFIGCVCVYTDRYIVVDINIYSVLLIYIYIYILLLFLVPSQINTKTHTPATIAEHVGSMIKDVKERPGTQSGSRTAEAVKHTPPLRTRPGDSAVAR
ncbi:hypothetical protein Tc00.1047053507863.10 [Trypanosoma cruzi]|uniref:Uncharacterized protein n=1 Tax=Trypanosoma cruzi (strain CL Brener) TaxID=353153 RepID=Q4CVI2_TRYCC|nr:hypothetical protein Tc00.1047053507863.10 [Trypanosoma cruzi]EAN84283.1 hypothetical protein Tc00.1047053507863.10 [Trypanosoma cruzi]|eukprot:XP_806134.1 hypothetical protein [Trypanosoma cruzi strain CL Brener]